MEDCSPRGDKNLILQNGPGNMRVWANQTVISDYASMTVSCAHNGILHHDTIPADLDHASALAHNACPMHDAGTGADRDVIAYGGVGRYPSGWI